MNYRRLLVTSLIVAAIAMRVGFFWISTTHVLVSGDESLSALMATGITQDGASEVFQAKQSPRGLFGRFPLLCLASPYLFPLQAYLAPCARLASEGRVFPVDIVYLSKPVKPEQTPVWELAAHEVEGVLRAEAEGRFPLYELDGVPNIQGPQFQQVLKEIGVPGGKWEDVSYDDSLTGEVAAGPFRKKGSVGVFDWEANGNNVVFADLLSGAITVQEALDINQANWEASYDI